MTDFYIQGGIANYNRQWRKVEKLYRIFPDLVLRDVAVDAGGEAIKEALPVAKARNYQFRDRTGKLRRSIRTRKRRKFGKRTGRSLLSVAYLIAGGKRAPHAYLVHQGHGGPKPAGPRPYLSNALDLKKNAIFQKFHNAFLNQMPPVIQKEARKLLIPPYRR